MNEKIKSAQEIRRAYLDFFITKDHAEVPSAPLVPKGDPTLLFTSAGMVQFKEYYLQTDNLPYTRATSVQKCLRAGDLESVGKTLRHHTFFEMLGNFSFGDYFKHDAIIWAWEFVIDVLDLPAERLYVSIYQDDDEAFQIWNERIGIPEEKIYRLGKEDNFWGPVGKTGICGPCSEIYYDTGVKQSCGRKTCAPGCDCDRYVEFWNLVFPQFFLEENGEYRRLKKPGIDTGLGLERLATIMQGVGNNFHTDLFKPIIDALLGIIPSGVSMGDTEHMDVNMAADHARALVFTISEGIYPANEGRGYLVRRLLRRALTRFYTFGVDKPFLNNLVDVIVEIMKVAYPEIEARRRDTAMIIRSEEENFYRTLETGKTRFESMIEEVKGSGRREVRGDQVFLMYDTFGLPLELTRALAAEAGLTIDEEGLAKEIEEQRRRAQEQSGFDAGEQEIVSMIEVTGGESSVFTGYESVGGEVSIRRYRSVEKSARGEVRWDDPTGRAFELVLDRSPFYATSGGQVADAGWMDLGGHRLSVRHVFKRGGEIVHLVDSSEPEETVEKLINREKKVTVQVDDARRLAIARNHTATHLLHAALREIVGRHVTQAGSLVDEERLRFDFNHFQAVSPEARRRITERVNGWIRDAIQVRTEWMEYQKAVESGAIALFDEKYGTRVRVVRISDISTELCGGTHVSNTGNVGLFLIVSESSVAAGVRRIEALTGAGAINHVQSILKREVEIAELLKVSPGESSSRLRSLLDENDALRKRLRRMERGEVGGELDHIIENAGRVDGILIAAGRVSVTDLLALREQADAFRGKVASGVAILSALLKGKLQFVVTVTDDLIKERKLTANVLVRELGTIAGGGGGGKKHLAQLGTKDAKSEKKVFNALPKIVKRLIS